MRWLKENATTILTAAVLLLTAGMAFARVQTVCGRIEEKADKAVIYRELDQIHKTLARIESKLDGISERH